MYQKATPVMTVAAIESALPFWVDVLGFELAMSVPDGERLAFAMLKRDAVELMFQTIDSVRKELGPDVLPRLAQDHTPLFLEVSDLTTIQGFLPESAILIREKKTSYGSRETLVQTPYGQLVTFAQFE